MKKLILSLLFLAPTLVWGQDLDWSSYPNGSFSYVYSNTGNKPVSATVTVTGSTTSLASSGDPSPQSSPTRLRLEADFSPPAATCVTVTIAFSQAVGNLNFNLFDIDKQQTTTPGSDSNYQDQVTISGQNGATSKDPTIGASSQSGVNTISGNVITGQGTSTDNISNTINFSGDITQVTIQYCSGPDVINDPGSQRIFIGNLNWDDGPLPVRLVSFTGQSIKDQIQLNWQTSSELNSDRFDIEHSMDARSFERIGSLPAQGYSTGRQVYSFWDRSPQVGVNYYRLRQVDKDASVNYLPIIAVHYEPGALYLTVSPLTVTEVLVRTNAPSPLFSVYSITGQSQLQRVEPRSGDEFVLHLAALPNPQVQIIRLHTGGGILSRKILAFF